MKKFFYFLLISIFFIFTACKSSETKIVLEDWAYEIDNEINPLTVNEKEFSNLSALIDGKKGFITLYADFTIPENFLAQDLYIYLGNVKIAHEFFLNGNYLGKDGSFPPKEFSSGEKSSYYKLSPSLLNYEEKNYIEIKIWVDQEGSVSEIPFVSTEEVILNRCSFDDFIYSKVHFLFAGTMFIIALMYFFLYVIRPKEKNYKSFCLLNLLSAIYLFNLFYGEFPSTIQNGISYLLFKEIFLGIVPFCGIYIANSFMHDYLRNEENKLFKSIRIIVTVLGCEIILLSNNMEEFYKFSKIAYFVVSLQFLFVINTIIAFIKRKEKSIYIFLIGYSPVLLALVICLIQYATHNNKYMELTLVISWVIVLLMFLGILLIKFANIQNQIEYLNQNLESIIRSRTKELKYTNSLLEETNYQLNYEKAKTQKEIELARYVQESFFHHDLPDFKNWEIGFYLKPMEGVSGDFYDVYVNENQLKGFGIFDISGHGIASGLVTMLVKNIINREFKNGENEELKTIMFQINDKVIEEKGDIENYLTGILVRIVNKNKLEIVNAGHPEPILFRNETKSCESIPRGDDNAYGAIGFNDLLVNFENVFINLKEKDELLMFTDGITEAMNKEREQFGRERLEEILIKNSSESIENQIKSITNEINIFTENSKQNDDATIIILRKK